MTHTKPKKEDYGWITQSGFDNEPSGWAIEGGEEAYSKAIEEWEGLQEIQHTLPLFSNGSEYHNWQSSNCHKCAMYECESTSREDAGCKLAFDLDFAQFGEDVPQETLDAIGYNAETKRLEANCKEMFIL